MSPHQSITAIIIPSDETFGHGTRFIWIIFSIFNCSGVFSIVLKFEVNRSSRYGDTVADRLTNRPNRTSRYREIDGHTNRPNYNNLSQPLCVGVCINILRYTVSTSLNKGNSLTVIYIAQDCTVTYCFGLHTASTFQNRATAVTHQINHIPQSLWWKLATGLTRFLTLHLAAIIQILQATFACK